MIVQAIDDHQLLEEENKEQEVAEDPQEASQYFSAFVKKERESEKPQSAYESREQILVVIMFRIIQTAFYRVNNQQE